MRQARCLALVLLLAACGSDDPAAPRAACRTNPEVLTLAAGARARVDPTDAGACFRLGPAGAHYLLVPEFAATGDDDASSAFSIGASTPATTAVTDRAALRARSVDELFAGPGGVAGFNRVQSELDRTLRARERALPVETVEPAPRSRPPSRSLTALATVDQERDFKVLEKLDGTGVKTAHARLRYDGTNVAIYVDVNAPEPGFTDEDLAGFGKLFDDTLYSIDVAAFGTPSDIDQNGRVVVLITPLVNALTQASRCSADGFVTGFFYGVDLNTRAEGSNKGELFYALAPDPAGTASCAHSKSQVTSLIPATFIHEFQHMISYNAHKLARGGSDEAVWLNEGLSHIAEELGSLYYEQLYPAPNGRTDPVQLFPDAAQSYVVPNMVNAYNFLAASRENSVTTFDDFGTLPERGAAWLFLRWLGDQKGSAIFRTLVQTKLTGTENVAAAAGEPFADLFADFGVAVWTDSLPGLARTAVPSRYRFASRNLRAIFGRLNATGSVGRAFPVEPIALGGAAQLRTMKTGTVDFYEVRVPAESASVLVRFAPGSTDAGFATALRAQVAAFRLPQ